MRGRLGAGKMHFNYLGCRMSVNGLLESHTTPSPGKCSGKFSELSAFFHNKVAVSFRKFPEVLADKHYLSIIELMGIFHWIRRKVLMLSHPVTWEDECPGIPPLSTARPALLSPQHRGSRTGWKFNRLFVGPSFGPRIGPSFGPSVKSKRSNGYTCGLKILAFVIFPSFGFSFGPRF